MLGRETGLQVGVAGGAAQLTDYSQVTRESIPIVVIAITFATFLVMVVVLRALLLAALAVASTWPRSGSPSASSPCS